MLLLALLLLFASLASVHGSDSTYYIGAGRYDITGPAAGVEMVRIRPPPPLLSPHFTQCMHTHTHTHTHMLLAFHGSLSLSPPFDPLVSADGLRQAPTVHLWHPHQTMEQGFRHRRCAAEKQDCLRQHRRLHGYADTEERGALESYRSYSSRIEEVPV